MATNKYKPHILVLPEDDANRQIANGFVLNPDINERNIQILPPAGGWAEVINEFKNTYIKNMRDYQERRLVLIIDFDDMFSERLEKIHINIPNDLNDRVFILGVLSEPERLKSDLRQSYEDIGISLSNECSDNINTLWNHDLLKQNKNELQRMTDLVKPFIFD